MSGETQAGTPERMASVAICVPVTDQVATFFAYDLARMMSWTSLNCPNTIELKIIMQTGSLIPRQRESLVDIVLEQTECSHILFLDSDMRFPKDLIPRFLTHNADAVCASYTERNPPFRPVAFPNSKNYGERVWTYPESTGTQRIEACGFGCVLLKTEMLRKLKKPRFMVGYTPNGHLGEDIYFFLKMQEAGIPLLLDHDVTKEVAHIGRFEFMTEHALQYLQQHPELDTRKRIITAV